MFYKKQGNMPPATKAGCVYEESYFHDGYLYLKYFSGNIPSEPLEEITQAEYEANKPVVPPKPEPTPQPTEEEILQAEMLLNQQQIISRQNEQDMVLAELLLSQQGV